MHCKNRLEMSEKSYWLRIWQKARSQCRISNTVRTQHQNLNSKTIFVTENDSFDFSDRFLPDQKFDNRYKNEFHNVATGLGVANQLRAAQRPCRSTNGRKMLSFGAQRVLCKQIRLLKISIMKLLIYFICTEKYAGRQ